MEVSSLLIYEGIVWSCVLLALFFLRLQLHQRYRG